MPTLELLNQYSACSTCGALGFFAEAGADAVVCRRCATRFAVTNGVVDLVAGRSRTRLDDIDYDAHYKVEDNLSRSYRTLVGRTGDLLRRPFDAVLEIGAGTGGLTIGMLSEANIRHALISDISPGMLAICRKRIVERRLDARVLTLLQTSDGGNLCVRPDSFDLVIGHFVVHHILDYGAFLASCCQALRPHGMAMFVEPGRAYFRCLSAVMERAVVRILRQRETWTEKDLRAIVAVYASGITSLKYQHDVAVQAGWEDKHIFLRQDFEDAGHRAGFAAVEAIPFGLGDAPWFPLVLYASQAGLSEDGQLRLRRELEPELPGPFLLIDDTDAAPSTVFVLRKTGAAPSRLPRPTVAAWTPPPCSPEEIDARYDVVAEIDSGKLRMSGWILGRRSALRVRVAWNGGQVECPIDVARVDVFDVYAGNPCFHVSDTLVSGFDRTFPLDGPLPETCVVRAEFDNGTVVELSGRMAMNDGIGRVFRL